MFNLSNYYSNEHRRWAGVAAADPFTKQFKILFDELRENYYRQGDPLFGKKAVLTKIGKLSSMLKMNDAREKDKLPIIVGELSSFREGVLELIKLMEASAKRARSDSRARDILRAVSKLQNRMETIVIMYEKITRSHVLLQSHFVAQRCGTKHKKEFEDQRLNIFYEPLYHYRDEYFKTHSNENLSNYLRCWEHLIQEPYYSRIADQELNRDHALEVQGLADELEIYALLGKQDE